MDFNFPVSPPVNNLIVPDVYDRLDAAVTARTRVANRQLDTKLRMQERVIDKYRGDAEDNHKKEAMKVKEDMARFKVKLPDFMDFTNWNGLSPGFGNLQRRKRSKSLNMDTPDQSTSGSGKLKWRSVTTDNDSEKSEISGSGSDSHSSQVRQFTSPPLYAGTSAHALPPIQSTRTKPRLVNDSKSHGQMPFLVRTKVQLPNDTNCQTSNTLLDSESGKGSDSDSNSPSLPSIVVSGPPEDNTDETTRIFTLTDACTDRV
jgi:hypothetical protein